ncbi:hypothetical protein F4604DRAFT_1923532 [Suillus subluteus]|nr:hypothetical protein F4604DRAFT_1923532 [Suillus subluteus]
MSSHMQPSSHGHTFSQASSSRAEHSDTVELTQEVLDVVLWKYHSKKIGLEQAYHDQMLQLLCNYLLMFHMELKKIIISLCRKGKYKNFVSQVLKDTKDTCQDFYYSNGKKVLKLTDEFQHSIPINGLILMATVVKGVLTGFHETSTDKAQIFLLINAGLISAPYENLLIH